MVIYADKRIPSIAFGIKQLKQALCEQNVPVLEKTIFQFEGKCAVNSVVVRVIHGADRYYKDVTTDNELKNEGFEIRVDANIIYVTGYEVIGAMYGLLDLAETVRFYGVDAVADKFENPFHLIRGVKFNLPFEPYDAGTPFEANEETVLTIEYWKTYIEFLAKNRYNYLSLWSENPFYMMFRLDKYPDTCPYDDVTLEKFKDLYKFIFKYAKDLGVQTFMITWNIRLNPEIIQGLGLPAELGDMFDRYDVIRDHCVAIPNNVAVFDYCRQHIEIIKDYFKECVKTMLWTYRDLTGMGTSASEEMCGTSRERNEWVRDVYLAGIEESGRKIPFICRSNMTTGSEVKEIILDQYNAGETLVSWKYSNAHMYSSTSPQFETTMNAWDEKGPDGAQVVYTVRNDDFHTLRGGDPVFLKEYIKNMKKSYVRGFYWGADGYMWGKDFQHVPHKHMTWQYDFEKHWYQFELLGRLGYNPNTPDDIWVKKYQSLFGTQGQGVYNCFKQAMRIFPPVQRTFWINYDFEWHPECLLTVSGFKSVIDFVKTGAMPMVGTLSIAESAAAKQAGDFKGMESAYDVVATLADCCDKLKAEIASIYESVHEEEMDGELCCTMLDMEAWEMLGRYYFCKINAALCLSTLEITGDEAMRDSAVTYLTDALGYWERLGAIWSSHYMPYKLVRSKYIFGYTYYFDDVKKDISLAKKFMIKK